MNIFKILLSSPYQFWLKDFSGEILAFSALPCNEFATYSSCPDTCPPTCTFPVGDPECTPSPSCVPGCECDKGYVLHNGQCLPEENCFCVDPVTSTNIRVRAYSICPIRDRLSELTVYILSSLPLAIDFL